VRSGVRILLGGLIALGTLGLVFAGLRFAVWYAAFAPPLGLLLGGVLLAVLVFGLGAAYMVGGWPRDLGGWADFWLKRLPMESLRRATDPPPAGTTPSPPALCPTCRRSRFRPCPGCSKTLEHRVARCPFCRAYLYPPH